MKEARIKDELSVCLYPLTVNMDIVETTLSKHFKSFKVHSELELKSLIKKQNVFCIVVGCHIRENTEILKIRKLLAALTKIPTLAYAKVHEAEYGFQLAQTGAQHFIPNPNLDLLLEKLHQLKVQATFRIDLREFGIDLDECTNCWTKKYLNFIVKDYNFLSYRFVNEIARILGISTKHLQRECSKDCGLTPKELLLGLRHYYSTYLLHTTLWSSRIIAEKCGFIDENKFYQSFKDKIGITTTCFRRHHHWQDLPALFMQNLRKKLAK